MTPQTGTTLDARLLCACASSYSINAATGVYTPDPVFNPAVNYSGTPQPISADKINACLVGQNRDGIIVAFRGTLTPNLDSALSLHDWLQDFFEVPKTCSTGTGKVPGAVHGGFYDAVMSIVGQVQGAIRNLNPAPVYVTGHSKGGAMASIGAYILSQNLGIPVQQVMTFASPRPGDSGFRDGYQAVIGNHIRYENYGDLVPLVPPSSDLLDLLIAIINRIPDYGPEIAGWFRAAKDWDYQPVGALEFITKGGQITPNEALPAQVLAVLNEIGEDVLNQNFQSIVNAHILRCGLPYVQAVCPTGVCA
jgi:hypothetical protein